MSFIEHRWEDIDITRQRFDPKEGDTESITTQGRLCTECGLVERPEFEGMGPIYSHPIVGTTEWFYEMPGCIPSLGNLAVKIEAKLK